VLLLAAAVFMRGGRASRLTVIMAAALLLAGLASLAGAQATRLASALLASGSGATPGIERTSLGGAFWVLSALAWLAAGDAIAHLGLRPVWRLIAGAAVIAPVLVCMAAGLLDQLSLLREYANRKELFNTALLQHVQIVLASLLPSLIIGVPLGIASVREGRWMNALRAPLFASLNIIQTIPSIALFGLLMAPLALLAASLPLLAQWGIKGVGLAPAVIALTLYSLLPIVRSTAAGMSQVPRPVIDAAIGMGLTARQVLWKVELPLALPVFIAGLRVATVQTIGMAVVAALIGAGGFGAIMFQGLLGCALDLVLLGVVPVVAMAVAVDAILETLASSLAHEF
ncbi:MAG: ABC transporter permease, partial [Polaromonas sp.]